MLKEDASYARQFEALYPDGVTRRNLGDAIAYFETRMFNRPDSPFLRTLEVCVVNSETVFRFFQRGWIALSAILVFALTGMTYAESDDPEVAHPREEIREKNPETDIEGGSPASLLLRLDGAGVMEAASALQQRYKAASMSMSE